MFRSSCLCRIADATFEVRHNPVFRKQRSYDHHKRYKSQNCCNNGCATSFENGRHIDKTELRCTWRFSIYVAIIVFFYFKRHHRFGADKWTHWANKQHVWTTNRVTLVSPDARPAKNKKYIVLGSHILQSLGTLRSEQLWLAMKFSLENRYENRKYPWIEILNKFSRCRWVQAPRTSYAGQLALDLEGRVFPRLHHGGNKVSTSIFFLPFLSYSLNFTL